MWVGKQSLNCEEQGVQNRNNYMPLSLWLW